MEPEIRDRQSLQIYQSAIEIFSLKMKSESRDTGQEGKEGDSELRSLRGHVEEKSRRRIRELRNRETQSNSFRRKFKMILKRK